MFSGFFLAAHFTDKDWYWREIWKRVRSIYVPFLFWSFCWWVVGKGEPVGVLKLLGIDIFTETVLPPMWYLWSLMIFIVISVLWARLVRTSIWAGLGVGGILVGGYATFYALVHCGCRSHALDKIAYLLMPVGVFCFLGLVCFYTGCFLRYYSLSQNVAIRKRVGWVALTLGILIVVAAPVAQCYSAMVPAVQSGFAIPCLMVGVWYLMPEQNLFGGFANYSFPLYVLHYFFCSILTPCFERCHDSLIITVAYGLSVVYCSLLSAWVIRKIGGRYLAWVFGGR